MPPFLVTEEYAAIWTGRPGATIRRWASEGRITRHGSGYGKVRYDLVEMHGKTEDEHGSVIPGATPQKLPSLAAIAA